MKKNWKFSSKGKIASEYFNKGLVQTLRHDEISKGIFHVTIFSYKKSFFLFENFVSKLLQPTQ